MIKKPVFVTASLLTVALLSGCSAPATEQPRDYRLPLLNQSVTEFCPASQRRVVVNDLMLSNGLLLQRSNTRIHAARYHRWSGSLEQQLQQSAQRLLTDKGCAGELTIRVMDFYGDNQGHGVVSGHWDYRVNGQLQSDSFYHRQPLAGDGYDALVEALNSAWLESLTTIKNATAN
ncbi:ABC-type transport auxiliary lipoprotein family protein [Idiomarina seosinensis]|uniref:PqiC family protein n=1 Tax=Idiomarina seosinensis TaxID=281739 RepID=UPI00384DDA1A